MSITQKGRYRVTDPKTGEVHEHNRHDKAYDKAIEIDADWIQPPQGWEVVMGFKVNPPPAPVEVNAKPIIDSTPAPGPWTTGQANQYAMAQHVTDDGMSPLVYSIAGLTLSLAIDSATGLLTDDGTGAEGLTEYVLTVDDGVNAPVNSLPFSLQLTDPVEGQEGTDFIHDDHPWTHLLEPLGVVPDQYPAEGQRIWTLSSTPNNPQPNGTGFWIDDGSRSLNGLMVTGTQQFHSVLVKEGDKWFRTERADQREPRNTLAVDAGGGHWKAPRKYWYGWIMRIDRADHRNQGYFCQWHTQAAAGGSPVVALRMRTEGLRVYLESNPDHPTTPWDNVEELVVANADLYGVTHSYIWEIFWDTRTEADGSEGIIRLYIDDNATPAFEWINKNNNQLAGVGSTAKLPYFKWGLYKSAFKSQGVDGDTHIQQHTNYTVMGAGGSRLGMLDAMMFDQII